VTISSANRLVSEPFRTVYSASKGAGVMLTKGVALDHVKRGSRRKVTARAGSTPRSTTPTPSCSEVSSTSTYDTIDSFQSIGRPGQPREIANVALLLVFDEASFMTGSVVAVDGGMTSQ
jgi:NAD(P)-dependent dehydrogenase (short-subunit alcohol dehydrogenase family)